MKSLIAAEWLRLRRRKDVWLVLAAPILLTCAAYGLGLASALSSLDNGSGSDLPGGPARDLSSRLAPFAFPQSIASALINGQFLVMALMAYLTAATVSAEFTFGTLRTSLLMHHARPGFIFLRLGAMGLLALCVLAIVTLLGGVLPLASHVVGADLPLVQAVSPATVISLASALMLLALLIVCTAGLEGVLTRSAGIPLILITVQFVGESAVGAVRAQLPQPLGAMTQLLPFSSARVLIERGQLAAGAAVPPASGADFAQGLPTPVLVAVALAWIVGLGALAGWSLLRADIDV